jgi:hypothetical protein
MPPTGVKSAKRKRQYEHIKDSAKKRGTSTRRAKEIAARTVNKQRAEAGQTKGSAKKRSSRKTAKKSTGSRKSSAKRTTRKSSSRKTARKSSSKKR